MLEGKKGHGKKNKTNRLESPIKRRKGEGWMNSLEVFFFTLSIQKLLKGLASF